MTTDFYRGEAQRQLTKDLHRTFPWVPKDHVVSLHEKEGGRAPAWTDHLSRDIVIDFHQVTDGDAAAMADLITEIGSTHPLVAGATVGTDRSKNVRTVYGLLAHEGAHAGWTTWKHELLTLKPELAVVKTMILFEEVRIEKRASDKGANGLLRHSFEWSLEKLAGQDFAHSPLAMAHTWALVVGRYTANIATWDEVEPIDMIVRSSLGDEVVDQLHDILDEAVAFDSTLSIRTASKLRDLALEWLDILGADPDSEDEVPTTCAHGDPGDEGDDESEGECEGSGEEGEGEDGDQKGSGDEDGEDTDGETHSTRGADKLSSKADDPDGVTLLRRAFEDLVTKVAEPIPMQDVTLADPAKTAAKVFASGKEDDKSDNWSTRTPSAQNRSHAQVLARSFEQMALPTITRLHVPSEVPPGRLRGREAVRQSAERSRGQMTTATPWERTKRLRTTSRPVVVGIMTDTSGSMGWAENFVADFAWTVATAGIRVGARTAAVTFGSRTEMVTRPGATPQQIRVRTANGSQEMFDEAAAALEGVLHFTTGAANAAKVLFIVSDGELVREGEPSRAAQRIEQFTNAGTLVVWVGASPHLQAGYHTHVRGSGRLVFIERSRDTAQMMTELEKSILTAARGMGV